MQHENTLPALQMLAAEFSADWNDTLAAWNARERTTNPSQDGLVFSYDVASAATELLIEAYGEPAAARDAIAAMIRRHQRPQLRLVVG
jgi:hypothetical protein